MRRRKREYCECCCPPTHRKYDHPMDYRDWDDDPDPPRGGFRGRRFDGRRGFRESPFFRREFIESPFFRGEFFESPFFFI
ncbi:hypothetical protein [Brevibacillus halotolerans]|uniref:hypothetical protein n=1 Tax=Brevibacillus halotolerans TaxID=1507437 RepID=UPI0015EF0E43|nr:hypothetical protein [Brevibacillus halotolerans]MBA4534127.1 hypothetical protein [Brevibacillus halotolerans]